MPLVPVLAVPGSPSRFLHCSSRFSLPGTYSVSSQDPFIAPPSTAIDLTDQFLRARDPHQRSRARLLLSNRPSGQSRVYSALLLTRPHGIRSYSSRELLEADYNNSGFHQEDADARLIVEKYDKDNTHTRAFQRQPSGRALKAQRKSRPASVLDAIQNRSKHLYTQTPPRKNDFSYNRASRLQPGGWSVKRPRFAAKQSPSAAADRDSLEPSEGPISLYTILSRHLRILTTTPGTEAAIELRDEEAALLRSEGYSAHSVKQWTFILLQERSVLAAYACADRHERPPLFLVLLFLRRQRIRNLALGIIMRHIKARLETETIPWSSLQVLVIRLLRHARVVWPETIPWIASLYTGQATRLYEDARREDGAPPPTFISELTRFSNVVLSLIALPATVRPLLASLHQEKAQFEILQFMTTCEPPLALTRTGFQATARNQLAHSKTSQERKWAQLKGPSWPPWKENRTAMDEELTYEFGVSRASRIMHRMFEAGYPGGAWEAVADMYAGWDTDLSPTIQTRTSLPHLSTQSKNSPTLKRLLWAARIRTTRTRREAWACFLAHEVSDEAASPEVYLAMFEKLHHLEQAEEAHNYTSDSQLDMEEHAKKPLLAGDMKEPFADPKSTLHHVYLSEPIPTFEELHHRMSTRKVRPNNKLLAFLVKNSPDFSSVLSLLATNGAKFDNGLKSLLDGSILAQGNNTSIPPYFLGAFIGFLCRFGRSHHGQLAKRMSTPPDPKQHHVRLRSDPSYLLEYAYTLLMHLKPRYNPAWTAYMNKVRYNHLTLVGRAEQRQHRASCTVAQYKTMCALFVEMSTIDLDPDDDQFLILCTTMRYTAWSAYLGRFAAKDSKHILSTAPKFLRTAFWNLVGADVDVNEKHQKQSNTISTLPPHIPDPAVLHAYVRALGMPGDHEGLYSFSIWAATHHTQITARANAQHSGPLALFRTLVALRVGLEGRLAEKQEGASRELIELVRAQIESVEDWGWPSQVHVAAYVRDGNKMVK